MHHAWLTGLIAKWTGMNPSHIDGMVMAAFVMLSTLVAAFLVTRKLSVDKPATGQQGAELVVGMLRNMITDIIPHHGEKYLGWIGPFAVFILIGNLLGEVPFFTSPTSYWLVTMTLGIASMLTYNFLGVRETRHHYLGHFTGPSFELGPVKLPWLLPLFVVLESITLFAVRPFSLSLRLFANIMGDHQVGGAFEHIAPLGVPIPFMLLGMLTCVIQTFIFVTLTIVFVSLSVEHH